MKANFALPRASSPTSVLPTSETCDRVCLSRNCRHTVTPQRRRIAAANNSWPQGRRNVWKESYCRCRNSRPKRTPRRLWNNDPKTQNRTHHEVRTLIRHEVQDQHWRTPAMSNIPLGFTAARGTYKVPVLGSAPLQFSDCQIDRSAVDVTRNTKTRGQRKGKPQTGKPRKNQPAPQTHRAPEPTEARTEEAQKRFWSTFSDVCLLALRPPTSRTWSTTWGMRRASESNCRDSLRKVHACSTTPKSFQFQTGTSVLCPCNTVAPRCGLAPGDRSLRTAAAVCAVGYKMDPPICTASV